MADFSRVTSLKVIILWLKACLNSLHPIINKTVLNIHLLNKKSSAINIC